MRDQRGVWPALLTENVVARSAPSLAVVGAAVFLSESDLALMTGPRTLLGPVNLFYVALLAFGQSHGARLVRTRPAAAPGFVRRLEVVLPALGIVTTLAVAAASGWMKEAVDVVDDDRFLLTLGIVGAGVALVGFGNGRRVGLRITGRVRESARVELQIGALTVALGIVGSIGGPIPAVMGVLAARIIGTALWMRIGPLRTPIGSDAGTVDTPSRTRQ